MNQHGQLKELQVVHMARMYGLTNNTSDPVVNGKALKDIKR